MALSRRYEKNFISVGCPSSKALQPGPIQNTYPGGAEENSHASWANQCGAQRVRHQAHGVKRENRVLRAENDQPFRELRPELLP